VAQRVHLVGDVTIDCVERLLHALARLLCQPLDVLSPLVRVGSHTTRIDRDRLGDANVRDARPVRRRQKIVQHICDSAIQQTRAHSLETFEDLLLAQRRGAIDVAAEAAESTCLLDFREIPFEPLC
jgi:hypothetical protein